MDEEHKAWQYWCDGYMCAVNDRLSGFEFAEITFEELKDKAKEDMRARFSKQYFPNR